jgi:hypothetical protein
MLAGSGRRNWHERPACRHRAARGVVAASGGPSDVFILDFDGVLVDSEPEASALGWQVVWHLLSFQLLRAEQSFCAAIHASKLPCNLDQVSMAGFRAAKEFWPGIVTDAEKDQAGAMKQPSIAHLYGADMTLPGECWRCGVI